MIHPEVPIYIDPRTSCTKDEAIAKLLGWMQGDIRHRHIEMTLEGVPAESLMHMPCFEGSIWDFLTGQREDAQSALQTSLDEFAEDDIERLVEKISGLEETIIKAKSYQRDIDDELAKGIESVLKVDQAETAASGVAHISLNSLDQWAVKKCGISIHSAPEVREEEPKYPVDVRNEKGGLTKTSANSLFLTLGFLINAFLEARPELCKKNTAKPNVSELALLLSAQATLYGRREPIRGQNDERIKDRIEEAMKIYNAAMGNQAPPME